MGRSIIAIAFLLLAALAARDTTGSEPECVACVPSAGDSDVPACLVACPAGHISFRVVVRDLRHIPLGQATVVVEFDRCSAYPVCPGTPNTDPQGLEAFLTTAGDGVADFSLPMAGVCAGSTVRVVANGIFLGEAFVIAMDQDGDADVDAADRDLVAGKIGTPDRSGDLNCDLAVTTADVMLVEAHLGEACEGVTGLCGRSWGALKVRYR